MRKKMLYSLAAATSLLMVSSQTWAGDIQWPATQQTTCYDDAGNTITCGSTTFPNQDADTWMTDPAVDQDTTSEVGTVIDNVTGLQWLQDASEIMPVATYADAAGYVSDMNDGTEENYGYTNWRIPTAQELSSLINSGFTYDASGTYGNFINLPTAGGATWGNAIMWTSTPDNGFNSPTEDDRMVVRFRNGTVNGSSIPHQENQLAALAVRTVTP